MTGFYSDYDDASGVYVSSAKAEADAAAAAALAAQAAAAAAAAAAEGVTNPDIEDIVGLESALDGKVDDPQVLTDVPLGALFTDTTYSNVSSFINDANYLDNTSTLDAGNF